MEESTKKRNPLEFRSLLEFIKDNDKFIIPVYQRNYDWSENQCRQLFNDLKLVAKNKLKDYLLGIIYSFPKEGGKERIVIDGQQRLTTILLLLLAMRDSIPSGKKKAKKFTKGYINNKYLINETRYTNKKEKIKLKQTKKDANIFDFLINGSLNKESSKSDKHESSNIYKNYEFFKGELKNENLDEIYNSIEELMIVDFLLQKDDDPQLIFQNLNATGLALTEADKIRNFILMKEDEKKQERYFNEYWKKIEENVAPKDKKVNPKTSKKDLSQTTEFIRNFLIYEKKSFRKQGKVYFDFRNFYFNKYKDKDKEGLLKELLQFSTYYRFILQPAEFSNEEIGKLLEELKTLKVTVFNPALLELLADHKNKAIDDTQLKEILETVISYVFRRSICGLPTNALNKIFPSLISDAENLISDAEKIKEKNSSNLHYTEILKYTLMKKGSSGRFPKDDEVKESLQKRDVPKNKKYLLRKLEHYNNSEMSTKENLEVEHIMPQTLTDKWEKDLGKNSKDIHEKYLHKLGNLTLIPSEPNKKISNKPFQLKQKEWFEDSRLYLNQDLKKDKIKKFTEKELKERAEILAEKALEIWKYPETTYVSDKKTKVPNKKTKVLDKKTRQISSYTLANEKEKGYFTGKKVIFLSIRNKRRVKVNSWREFYLKAVQSLLESNPGYLEKIKKIRIIKIGSKKEAGHEPREVIPGIYLDVNFDPGRIVKKHLTKIVDGIGFKRSDIKFWIEKVSDKKIKTSDKKIKQKDFYTLNDIKKSGFAKKKVIHLFVCDEKKVKMTRNAKVTSWADIYVEIIKYLLKSDPKNLKKIKALDIEIGTKREAGSKPKKVHDSTYVNVGHLGEKKTLKKLANIFKKTKLNKNQIKFQVK